MVMMVIANVNLLIVLIGKASRLLSKDQEMKMSIRCNQMLMAMNQNWQEMKTMLLKVTVVILRMKTRARLHINCRTVT